MKIPSKHKINIAHDELLSKNFSGTSVNEVIRSVEKTYGLLPTIGNQISSSFRLIRAREINPEREDITNKLTFGPPPIQETREGRANIVGYPVLYGATSARTAMREINAEPGKEYFVSIWDKKADAEPLLISLYALHAEGGTIQDPSSKFINEWVKNATEFLIRELRINKSSRKTFMHAIKLRSSLFTMSHYGISSRLAHSLLFDNTNRCNGIVYPSVADDRQVCFAISPDYAYQSMSLVRIYKMVFSEGWIFRSLARAIPDKDNGLLDWQNTGEYEIDDEEREYMG